MGSETMVTKRFFVVGDGLVKGVGLRPSLIPEEQRVEVVVEGVEGDVEAFWELIKRVNVRAIMEGAYNVTDLEDYAGPEVDWTYAVSVVTLEQIAKGVPILLSIDGRLGSIEKALEGLPTRIAEELRRVLQEQ